MIKKIGVVVALVILCNYYVFSQQSAVYTSELADYQKALSLYNSKQYLAAQTLFHKVLTTAKDEVLKSDCAYYIANSAVRLNQQNADDLIEKFVAEYPTSTKRNTAFMDVADYYFENSRFAYARKWYNKVDEDALARKERETFNFNYGYSLYATNNKQGAKKYLSRVENSEKYGAQAKYYIGFMAYEGDDYEKASEYFDQISDSEKYKEGLSYYQADLNFKLGNFDKAIELAKEQLPTSDDNEVSELSKIIGESYFNLQQYDEAIPFLTEYKGKRGRWNNTDYYQLGYAYYKQKEYDKAISEFNKIIDGNNSVAQNAYYHLGESYINVDKKQEALNAFRNASQMDYDLKIQEDAWLNYARISYEIGNPYLSAPQVLAAYLDKYPKTSYKEEIETLLIDSYITSKNYKEALKLLEGRKSFENKVAYQKVAFYRGIELYNESKYLEAESFFDKSLKEPRDDKYTARATFWKAETDYNLANYNDALLGLKQFQGFSQATSTKEIINIDYNLAYTYFKQKNYAQSTQYFQNYISNTSEDKVRLNDAYLRLGDGYFVTSDGYIGQGATKIEKLNEFIETYKRSSLRDDALYELGNSYVKTNEVDKAMQMYDRLNAEYKSSQYISKSLLRQGLVHFNSGKDEQALIKFKRVANKFPGSPEANQAVASARLIYIDLGRVDEYASWVRTLDYINLSDADLDNATYEAAEKQYLANNNKAIRLFNAYLNEFPNGLHALPSHFYLAQLYYKDDLKANATPHYNYVINKPNGEFTELALTRLSEIYLNGRDWSTAIPILERLEIEANFSQNIIFAQSNLMKANYQLERYQLAVSYAEKVLSSSKIDTNIKSDAHIIIARSAMKTGNEERARTAYAQVERTASGELAAEALYFNALFKHKEGNYELSNIKVQKLAKDYSGYKYYGAKGLVTLAGTQNFTEFEDVISESQTELNKIKIEQARTNSSVETDEGN